MKTPISTEINVDELMQSGVFPDLHGSDSTALVSMGGALKLTASKPASLMKLASVLQEAAAELLAAQKVAASQRAIEGKAREGIREGSTS